MIELAHCVFILTTERWTFTCITFSLLGTFYDDVHGGTFGTLKKGARRPLSNFNFEYLLRVNAEDSRSTGFLVRVYPERSADSDSESDLT
jgi:hypothetical protein